MVQNNSTEENNQKSTHDPGEPEYCGGEKCRRFAEERIKQEAVKSCNHEEYQSTDVSRIAEAHEFVGLWD